MPDAILSSTPLDSLILSKSTSSKETKSPEKLKDSCSELESLFVYYLLKEMRNTIPKSGLMGDKKTEEMYQSMLDLQLSKEISSKREIGIASMLYRQMSDIADDDKHDEAIDERKMSGLENDELDVKMQARYL